jgi:hypothetical protein
MSVLRLFSLVCCLVHGNVCYQQQFSLLSLFHLHMSATMGHRYSNIYTFSYFRLYRMYRGQEDHEIIIRIYTSRKKKTVTTETTMERSIRFVTVSLV